MNAEQQKVYDDVVQGKSVVVTGAGGVGKSYLIDKIVSWTQETNINVGITAMTGCAAILVRGTTLHSFLGIGLGNKPVADLVRDVSIKRRSVVQRLLSLELLVVDEISMLNDSLMDMVSEYLCAIRRNPRPFGGVQFVFSGDLYQIPPISGKMFFHSKVWNQIKGEVAVYELKSSQRHKGDEVFHNILAKLRTGVCDENTVRILTSTQQNTFKPSIKPTILYTKNVDVDIINNYELEKLVTAGATMNEYHVKTSNQLAAKSWATSCKVPDSVRLCVGAQVMLTWNIDLERKLVNGSRGVVTSITPLSVTVEFQNAPTTCIEYTKIEHPDNKDIWIKFMPLRLAYAVTVNKSQGSTLDAAIIDMDIGSSSAEFLYGKFYTAISRVRDLKSVIVKNVKPSLFVTHPDVPSFYMTAMMDKLTI